MAGRRARRTAVSAVTAVAVLALAVLAFAPAAAFAQGQLRWVEVALSVDADGQARVTYQVRYRTSGTMSGFYFQGETAAPRFRGGTAELPGGEAVPLSITAVGPTSNGGTVTINDNGTPGVTTDDFVQYNPADNFNGNEPFTYTNLDGKGGDETGDQDTKGGSR